MQAFPACVVNGVIFNENNEVLLTLRRDTPLWCLPGGYVEYGESAELAIKREIMEEIGVEVSVDHCIGIYSAANIEIVPPAKKNIIILCFRCSITKGAPTTSDEVQKVEYFSYQSITNCVRTHFERIEDGLKMSTSTFIK